MSEYTFKEMNLVALLILLTEDLPRKAFPHLNALESNTEGGEVETPTEENTPEADTDEP